jgi:hypothetical protein
MHFFQAVLIAFDTIRVQKLKSFFTVIGVTIGVTFLIAVVSIVGGMNRYMKDDLVGKLIAVNSFSLRATPDFQMGDVTQEQRNEYRRRPRITNIDVPAVAASLAPDVLWAVESGNRIAGLVHDQEDGHVARPAHRPPRIRARHAGRRRRPRRRGPFFSEPQSHWTSASDPEHSVYRGGGR